MISSISRLIEVAKKWQEYRRRTVASAVGKVKEEIEEFEEAEGSYLDELDELGDVLVNAMRALTELSPTELEFVCRVTEMKANRRLPFRQGNKDKVAEAIETKEIAKKLGLL